MREKMGLKLSAFRVFLFALAALAGMIGLSFAASLVCNRSEFDDILSLSALAAVGTGSLIVLGYMFGEFFQNPKLLTWAKTEALQIGVSLVVVIAILGALTGFCSLAIGDTGRIFSALPAIYSGFEDKPMYDAGVIYLQNLMSLTHTNMMSLRYSLGAYEIRTTYTKMDCDKGCWISFVGSNIAVHSGESLLLAVANNLLSTATISYLSSLLQYFTLQYINNGIFVAFLPIAIVMRSMPFMRQFGGALVAIFISLYIMYPVMLGFDSIIASGMAGGGTIDLYRYGGCPGSDLLRAQGRPPAVNCHSDSDYDEMNMDLSIPQVLTGSLPPTPPLDQQARASALIFLIAVFLPALNFIIIAAMARGVGQLLGEDVDISRLGQMV